MREYIAMAGLAGVLSGCAVSMTDEARLVRQIPPESITPCRFLGVIEGADGWSWSVAGDARDALTKVRNRIAAMGGNAYVLTQTTTSNVLTITQVDAYACPAG